MADTIPGATFVTIEAGHLVHTTRPDAFLAAVRAFGLG
jgi:pimeloyl-ACP methyl ester carboxylesterase